MSTEKDSSILTIAAVGVLVYMLFGRRAMPMPMPQQYGQQVMQGPGYTPVIGAYATSPMVAGSIQQQAQVVRQSQSNAWGAVGSVLGKWMGGSPSVGATPRSAGQVVTVAGSADPIAAPRIDTWGQDDVMTQDMWAASPAVNMAADDPSMYAFYG